jgi:hypothetical protein
VIEGQAVYDPENSNVDRLYAIWQSRYPDECFDSPVLIINSSGQTVAAEKPETTLKPFRDANGELYDSNGTRSSYGLGYSYPELQIWLRKYNPNDVFNSELFTADINRKTNQPYGPHKSLRSLLTPSAPPSVTEMDYVVNVRYESEFPRKSSGQLIISGVGSRWAVNLTT